MLALTRKAGDGLNQQASRLHRFFTNGFAEAKMDKKNNRVSKKLSV